MRTLRPVALAVGAASLLGSAGSAVHSAPAAPEQTGSITHPTDWSSTIKYGRVAFAYKVDPYAHPNTHRWITQIKIGCDSKFGASPPAWARFGGGKLYYRVPGGAKVYYPEDVTYGSSAQRTGGCEAKGNAFDNYQDRGYFHAMTDTKRTTGAFIIGVSGTTTQACNGAPNCGGLPQAYRASKEELNTHAG